MLHNGKCCSYVKGIIGFSGEVVRKPAAHEADSIGRGAGSRQLWVYADAVCADLAERGVSIISGPLDRPWGMRSAAFLDPDGYVWEVSADIRSS